LGDAKEITDLYNETIAALTKDAELAYQQKELKQAILFYTLLLNHTVDEKLKTEYQTKLQNLERELWLVENWGFDPYDLGGKSLYAHLMEKKNETPYNGEIVSTIQSALVEKEDEEMRFIFNIHIKDLFKGGN
jgi:hypothetical protein